MTNITRHCKYDKKEEQIQQIMFTVPTLFLFHLLWNAVIYPIYTLIVICQLESTPAGVKRISFLAYISLQYLQKMRPEM